MTFTSEQLYKAILTLCHASADSGIDSVGQFIEEINDPEEWAQKLFNSYVVIMSQPI